MFQENAAKEETHLQDGFRYCFGKLVSLRMRKQSRTQIVSYLGHTGPVFTVDVTANGRYVVTGSADNTIRVWDAMTCAEVAVLTGHKKWVKSVQFWPNAATDVGSDAVLTTGALPRYIISASSDYSVKAWTTEDGACIRTLKVEAGSDSC